MALREVEKLEPSNERSVEIALELKLGRISCHPVATDTGRRVAVKIQRKFRMT